MNWTYTLTTGPAGLAVSLADFKTHLKISGTDQDTELTDILTAAILFGEQYTKRDFVNKTYTTYRDELSQVGELRRSKLQSVTSIKYLIGGVLTAVDTAIYYNTEETDFSSIELVDGESWPTGGDTRRQAVEVIFVAGYGADETAVPWDIKQAIMQHATNYFKNRGDCSLAGVLPPVAASIYNLNRIKDIVL